MKCFWIYLYMYTYILCVRVCRISTQILQSFIGSSTSVSRTLGSKSEGTEQRSPLRTEDWLDAPSFVKDQICWAVTPSHARLIAGADLIPVVTGLGTSWGPSRNKPGFLDNHRGSRHNWELTWSWVIRFVSYTRPFLQAWERGLFRLLHRGQHKESSKMRKQTNSFQMKERDWTWAKCLNETDISHLPEKEFKLMVVKMVTQLGQRMDERWEYQQKERKI